MPPLPRDVEPSNTKLLLTVDEAAAVMSLGRTLLYRLVMRGEIISIKVGRTRRVPMWALREVCPAPDGRVRGGGMRYARQGQARQR
jgi:excisionase family DNA binding protein